MSLISNALLVCVLCVALNSAIDLQLGNPGNNSQLGYQETVKLSSVPFTTRIKNVFYNSNNTKIIKVGCFKILFINRKEKRPLIRWNDILVKAVGIYCIEDTQDRSMWHLREAFVQRGRFSADMMPINQIALTSGDRLSTSSLPVLVGYHNLLLLGIQS